MRRTAMVSLALIALLSGCFQFDMGFGPGTTDYNYGGGCWGGCSGFTLFTENYATAMLKGDTIRVKILSFAGNDTASNWSVTGGALALVDADSLTSSIRKRSASILAKAVAAGVSTVRAVAADTAIAGTLVLKVVDTAAITGITINAPPNLTLKTGFDLGLPVHLLIGYEMVAGRPTSVSIADTTVLQVNQAPPQPAQWAPNTIVLRGMKPGITEVTVRFLEFRSTVTFTVIP